MIRADESFMATMTWPDRGHGRAPQDVEHYRREKLRERESTEIWLKLPGGRAQAKFRRLEDRNAERHAVRRVYHGKIEHARRLRDAQEVRLAEIKKRPLEKDGQIEFEAEELRRLNAEVAELQRALSEKWADEGGEGAALSAIKDYITDHAGAITVCEAAPAPPLAPGQSHLQAVEAARAQVASIKERLLDVEDAPYPAAWCKAKARAQIDALAAAPNVSPLIDSGAPIAWPAKFVRELAHDAPDAIGLALWALRDQIVSGVEALIDDNADDQSALTPEQRKAARAELLDALLQAERAEEAAIVAAAEAGVTVIRRADCDPRSVLEVCGPPPRGRA